MGYRVRRVNLTVNSITKLVGFSANYQLRHIDRWLIGAIPVNPIAGGSSHVHVAFLLVNFCPTDGKAHCRFSIQ